ncbi:MAG: hypothetical protein ACTSU5_01960 [Promethearchaeota archaeon]
MFDTTGNMEIKTGTSPRCEACGDVGNLVTTPEGFRVCRTCGVEQPEVPVATWEPFSRTGDGGVSRSRSAMFETTTRMPGTRLERVGTAVEGPLTRTHHVSYKTHALRAGYFEVRKACAAMGLSVGFARAAYSLFSRAWKRLPSGSKARNTHLLALASVVREAALSGVVVLPKDLAAALDGKNYSPKDLASVLVRAACVFPKVTVEQKKRLVRAQVGGIVEELAKSCQLHPDEAEALAYAASGVTREYFSRPLVPSKVPVVAASIAALALLLSLEEGRVPLSRVASLAGVAQSAVNSYTARVVSRNYGLELERGLVRCRPLLRELFVPLVGLAPLGGRPGEPANIPAGTSST